MRRIKFWDALCHVNIIVGAMFVVFFILDRFNPGMQFLDSEISKWLLLFFCVCAIANGVVGAVHTYGEGKKQSRHQKDQLGD